MELSKKNCANVSFIILSTLNPNWSNIVENITFSDDSKSIEIQKKDSIRQLVKTLEELRSNLHFYSINEVDINLNLLKKIRFNVLGHNKANEEKLEKQIEEYIYILSLLLSTGITEKLKIFGYLAPKSNLIYKIEYGNAYVELINVYFNYALLLLLKIETVFVDEQSNPNSWVQKLTNARKALWALEKCQSYTQILSVNNEVSPVLSSKLLTALQNYFKSYKTKV